jgi:serine/threonine protein kinase
MNGLYSRLEKNGSGTYGTIYKCSDVKNKEIVAIKKLISWNDEDIYEYDEYALNEINILQKLKHPNIVKFINAYKDINWFIIMEFIDFNLNRLMEFNILKPELIKSLSLQLLRAVSYIHNNNIIHLDIKPQNILVTKDNILKLCDFGESKTLNIGENFDGKIDQEIVSLWYRAPEILFGDSFDHGVDVWSVGLVLYHISTNGKILFKCSSEKDQILSIFELLGTPNKTTYPNFDKLTYSENLLFKIYPPNLKNIFNIDDVIFDIISKIFVYDKKKRITANEAFDLLNNFL